MSWSTANGKNNFITTTAAGTTASGIFNSSQNWYNTVAGRFGYLVGNYMLYAKVGGAWRSADYSLAVSGPLAAQPMKPDRDTSPAAARNGCFIRAGRPRSNMIISISAGFRLAGRRWCVRQFSRLDVQGRRELASGLVLT
jgi:hypothetical protein